MIQQECIDELAAEIGLRAEIAAITESAMRGEIAFEPALRERVALFKGLSSDVVERVLAERIDDHARGAELIATMRAAGAHTALVSGGFSAFVEPVGRKIGFHETRANVLLERGRRFHRLRRRADPRRRRQGAGAARAQLRGLASTRGDASRRRWRERLRHDPPRRARRRLSRQARAQGGSRRDDRPRGPDRRCCSCRAIGARSSSRIDDTRSCMPDSSAATCVDTRTLIRGIHSGDA